jgi:hypothetical protein
VHERQGHSTRSDKTASSKTHTASQQQATAKGQIAHVLRALGGQELSQSYGDASHTTPIPRVHSLQQLSIPLEQ